MTLTIDYLKVDTNYIWLIRQDNRVIIIDPGSSAPVLQYVSKHNLIIEKIMITHNHSDHIAGLPDLYIHH